MNHSDPARSRELSRRLLRLTAGSCLVATGILLAGCAYTQTMNERTAEQERLQSELQYEQDRTKKLSR